MRNKWVSIIVTGIWHNFVLALVAAALFYSLPYVIRPVYMVNKGVLVTNVESTSSLAGAAGLSNGDVLFGINYCKVYNSESWHTCLHRLLRTNYGYCIPRSDAVQMRAQHVTQVNGEIDCCGPNRTHTHLCFHYKLQLNESSSSTSTSIEHSCLPARYVTDHYVCNYSLPCSQRALVSFKIKHYYVNNVFVCILYVCIYSSVCIQHYLTTPNCCVSLLLIEHALCCTLGIHVKCSMMRV